MSRYIIRALAEGAKVKLEPNINCGGAAPGSSAKVGKTQSSMATE